MTHKVGRCGSLTGRDWHANRNEPTCQTCRDVYAEWQRGYKKQVYLQRGPMLIPSIGTQRRIQAMMWMGWTHESMGELLQLTSRSVGNILARQLVHRATAARIADLYDRLAGVPGPSEITRRRARAAGYASWAAWDDIDNPDERPATPDEAERERWRRSKRNKSSRKQINAQNYQRRKQGQEVA